MVGEITTSFILENDKAFIASIDRLAKATNDFRIPFNLIRTHWYKGNRKLFTLTSRGLYPPLGGLTPGAPSGFGNQTKQRRAEDLKERRVGFAYPVLVGRSRRLMKSLIFANAEGAESFVGRKVLLMGTSIPYAGYHQSDRPRTQLPQRKHIFIDGGPAEKAKDAKISGRREAWINIIDDYIKDLLL